LLHEGAKLPDTMQSRNAILFGNDRFKACLNFFIAPAKRGGISCHPQRRPMKILISAYSSDPYRGSEDYGAWSAIRCLARDHELQVITSSRNRESLARAAAAGIIPPGVGFHFAGRVGPFHPNRFRARLQGWREYQDYARSVLPVARALHRAEKFDLVHHLTAATWRVASPLWQLGIPLVFGPVGGNENFPLRLLPILSPSGIAYELLRMGSNLVSRSSPAVKRCLRRAAHVFAANAETEELMVRVRGSARGVSRLSQAFYAESTIADFARFDTGKPDDGPLRLFASGSIEGRKGVALALLALARARQNGVAFRYQINASGPELEHLKNLVHQLELTGKVVFGGQAKFEDYQRILGATQVYLLPSIRDSAGLSLMEAMLAGCVPVVADCGGPGAIVTENCGFKIPVVSREQMVAQLASVITEIHRDRKMIFTKGPAARQRIATAFSETNYRQTVNAVYQSVISQPGQDRAALLE
jgi:glycosyltransferase involved in cell wall biosynthesis